MLIISSGGRGDFGKRREVRGTGGSYREWLNQAPELAPQESLPLLQLPFLVLQPLQPLVPAELAADGGQVEIPVGVAQAAAAAQQSPIQSQHRLPGPRGHGGQLCGAGGRPAEE